jgi:hypothetical protein
MYWKTWLKSLCPQDWTVKEIHSFLIASNVTDVTEDMIINELK